MKRLIMTIISAAVLYYSIYGETGSNTNTTDAARSQIIAGLYMGGGKLFNSNAQNNLDWLYGNVYLGMEYEYEQLSGTVVVAVFMEGLQHPPYFNAEVLNSPNSPEKPKKEKSNVNVWDAHVKLNTEVLDIKFGRWMLSKGVGRFYGNYSSAPYRAVGWWSVGSMRNQLELSGTVGHFHGSISVSPDDMGFKKGMIHAYFRFTFKDFLKLSFSFGANVFDRINDADALITNNLDICIEATPIPQLRDFMVFVDMGFVDITDKEFIEVKHPVSFGFTIPTNKGMDLVQVEMEVLHDRKWVDHDLREKDAPFLFGLHFNKEFLNHFNFEGALYCDGSPENIAVEFGLDSWF